MHETSALKEAGRLMTVCNACRYCEGLCAVFPAMEMRRSFSAGDLNYLANLCHGCGACYADCQYSPPHEFNVNVPRTLAIVRANSYAAYAWPEWGSALFARNGLAVAIIAALSIAAFLTAFAALQDLQALFGVHNSPGAFYALMPHSVMALLFGGAFLYAALAIAVSLRRFWRDTEGAVPNAGGPLALWQAAKDAAKLRYLDGGGAGCSTDEDRPRDRRKRYHHLTFYGFLLCFAATSVATIYHYVLQREAPYAFYDLPVIIGTLGGIGLLIGPAGLLAEKLKSDADLADRARFGMDTAFIAMLFLTSATGIALLLLRNTAAMGLLLALHLGVVFGLFITLPYGKFVHGLYRYAALVRYAGERRPMARTAHG
jgi:citrate/tricarballylate utilization protein